MPANGTATVCRPAVQRQLITIAASAPPGGGGGFRPRHLAETLAAAEELLHCVESKCGLLEISVREIRDEARRAWAEDARAAYHSSPSKDPTIAPALVAANAHRAAMAHVCRHLWHGVLRSVRHAALAAAASSAAPPDPARTRQGLEGIAMVYAGIHIFIPTFDVSASPPEREADMFREAIVPSVRRRMGFEASEMARRACELAEPYVSGASDNEPLLDLSTTVVLPLRSSKEEAVVEGWTPTQAKLVRRFVDMYTCGPICVTSQVLTNKYCGDRRPVP